MMTEPSHEAIPDSLLEYPQWVCWTEQERDGKLTKIPVDPRTGEYASTNDAGTWTDFEAAVEYATRMDHAAGIGFVFTDDDPFVGVDLDDCRHPDTGRPSDRAKDIVARLDSYTEVSPSGGGFHVLLEGSLPDGRSRRGAVEMYDSGRFFTVTGSHVEGTPQQVAPRRDALTAVHREYVTAESGTDSPESPEPGDDPSSPMESRSNGRALDDETLVEKARAATNGAKFERLWSGNTSGYASHSEADMALCFILAFWTNGDATQIDRLFRRSGLMREKWDEVHYSDGATYGEMTVERAIEHTGEGYDPDQRSGSRAQAPRSTDEQSYEDRYTQEKVRLLERRLAEVEALLERKDERIATLEATVETVRESDVGTTESPTEPDHSLLRRAIRRLSGLLCR